MKRVIAIALLILVILAILFTPIQIGTVNDGGTKVYSALTYKIVKWNRFSDSYKPYKNTSVYFFPQNYSSLDKLWQKEEEKLDGEVFGDYSFVAIITETWGNDGSFLIKDENSASQNGDTVLSDSDNPKVIKNNIEVKFSDLKIGDRIKITYDGMTLYTYPGMLGKIYEIEIL